MILGDLLEGDEDRDGLILLGDDLLRFGEGEVVAEGLAVVPEVFDGLLEVGLGLGPSAVAAVGARLGSAGAAAAGSGAGSGRRWSGCRRAGRGAAGAGAAVAAGAARPSQRGAAGAAGAGCAR